MSAGPEESQLDHLAEIYSVNLHGSDQPYRIESSVVEDRVAQVADAFSGFDGKLRVEIAEESYAQYHRRELEDEGDVVFYVEPAEPDQEAFASYLQDQDLSLDKDTYYDLGGVVLRLGEHHPESVPATYASNEPVPDNIELRMPTQDGARDQYDTLLDDFFEDTL